MKINCEYCGKEILNRGSLSVHEKYYCKLNKNRIEKKSNFIKYNQDVKVGLVEKLATNQFTKAKLNGTVVLVSENTKKKISDSQRNKPWSDTRKQNHSKVMKDTVDKHPESYSVNNISGRVKQIEYNGNKLHGNWELEVAKFLDRQNVKWTTNVKPIPYIWKNSVRNYFPDFYLPELDLYIEVKGFQYNKDRDTAKWLAIKNLMIIRQDDIKKLRLGIDLDIKANQ